MGREVQARLAGLSALPRKQVFITIAGVMLAMFLGSLDQTIVGTAMPRIIADLGGFTHYTWVTTAYIITSAIAIPITGKLTDMYGRKWFYIAGIIIFVAGSLLSGFSQSMTQIIISRGFQGVGAGIMMSNAFVIIGDLFPPAERGKYQGYISGVFGISSIIGPMLGGYITDSFSWHWVFFINVPLGVLIIVLFILFFPHIRPDNLKHRVDFAGLIALIMAVVPAMLAFSWAGVEYPWGSAPIIVMLCFSAIMGAIFVGIEQRAKEPIMPLWLLKNRIVSVSLLIIFMTGVGMFGAIIFVPLFFQGVLGLSAAASGKSLTPMMLGMMTGALISGQLLSRAGGHYRLQGMFGLAIMASGLVLLSRMTAETTYAAAIRNIVLTGFGLGITMPLYTIAVQNAVPYEVLGVATSSTAFFRSIGGTIGLAVFGSVMNNRFAAEFINGLSPAAKSIIPPERLNALAHNPQALVSVEAQAQLKSILGNVGAQGANVFGQVLSTLRHALSSGISEVFLIAFGTVVVALMLNFFLREIPLGKRQAVSDPPA